MKTYIKSLLPTIGPNGRMPSLVAGRLIRAMRLITNVGIGTCHRELASLRYLSLLRPEPQDPIEHGKSGSFAELVTFAAVLRT
jgi:hypothetical protein